MPYHLFTTESTDTLSIAGLLFSFSLLILLGLAFGSNSNCQPGIINSLMFSLMLVNSGFSLSVLGCHCPAR